MVNHHWVHAPNANHKPHPPGVTWHNCRKRTKGCEACVAELEAEGYYQKQEEELKQSLARGAGIALSAEEANIEFTSHLKGWTLAQQQESQDAKIISKFWTTVRKLGS